MEQKIKEIKKELRHAIAIEEAILEMMIGDPHRTFSDDDLKLLVSKLVEACGYIVQLTDLLEEFGGKQ